MVDASTMTGIAPLQALILDLLRHATLGVEMPLPSDEVPQFVTLNVVEEPQPDQAEVVPAGAALPLDPGPSDEEVDIGHRREPE